MLEQDHWRNLAPRGNRHIVRLFIWGKWLISHLLLTERSVWKRFCSSAGLVAVASRGVWRWTASQQGLRADRALWAAWLQGDTSREGFAACLAGIEHPPLLSTQGNHQLNREKWAPLNDPTASSSAILGACQVAACCDLPGCQIWSRAGAGVVAGRWTCLKTKGRGHRYLLGQMGVQPDSLHPPVWHCKEYTGLNK